MKFRFLAMVLLSIFVMEVSVRLAWPVLVGQVPDYDRERLDRLCTISQADYETYRSSPNSHPELGFWQPPEWSFAGTNAAGHEWRFQTDATGARQSALEERTHRIATYGDSFTAGADVNDDETWQHFAGVEMGETLDNYGIFGGAPDQALLFFEEHARTGRVPEIAVLGMIPENMGRIVTSLYCYYQPESGMRTAFKPRFTVQDDGEFGFAPNPGRLPTVLGALEEAQSADFWYERDQVISRIASWPLRSLGLADLGLHWQMLTRPEQYVQSSERSLALLDHLIRQFSSAARRSGTRAVLLVLPTHGNELGRYRDPDAPIREFVDFAHGAATRNGLAFVDVFGTLTRHEQELGQNFEHYNVAPNEGHPSVTANRIIGHEIARALQSHPAQQEEPGER